MLALMSILSFGLTAVLFAGLLAGAYALARERRRRGHTDARLRRRTEELKQTRQQLADARRMEAVGILAGGIVNNLNNLLSAILGSARLAADETDSAAPVRTELDRVMKAGHQATELVRELSDFYRDADRARRPQDLLPIVRDTVKLLQDIVPTNVELRVELASCGPVFATPDGVQQIIMSLCSGAVRGMNGNAGRLDIRLGERRLETRQRAHPADIEPGAYACLSIGGVSEGPSGAIAGLSPQCEVLGVHGGVSVVPGDSSTGTTCDFYFPLIAWRVESKNAAAEPETGLNVVALESIEMETESEVPGPARGTILLVDDEEMVARVLSRGLRRLGYRVVAHLDSRTALADFAQTPDLFDIVITDQIMPHLSGVRLAQRIHEIRSNIPVALCTGFRDSFNEQQARDAGVADFILKPASPHALAALVDRNVIKRMEGRG